MGAGLPATRDSDAPAAIGAPDPGQAELSPLIAAEQASSLFGQGLFPYLTNVVNGAILVYVLGDRVDRTSAVLWYATLVGVTLLRIALWAAHRRDPGARPPARWLLVFSGALGVSGLVWGSAAVVMFVPGDDLGHALLGFVLGGITAGATATAHAYFPAFALFAPAALTPLFMRLVASGTRPGIAMAAMMVLFGTVMLLIARRSSASFAQSTRLRLGNAGLVQKLSEAQALLEQRVADRTAELERTVAQLKDAEAKAQAAVRARDEFLAVASHELRTPLTALHLQLHELESRLARGDDPRPRLARLQRVAARLGALVDTVLTASGVARTESMLDVTDVDLATVTRNAVVDIDEGRADRRAPLAMEIAGPVVGRFDPVRVGQIVTNLLSNALKYGDGAPIVVSVRDDGDRAVLCVRDRGPGIPDDQQERLFQKFTRAAGDRQPGLGLGLFVVHDLVRAMGGTVSVASRVGEGTAFTVQLPRSGPPSSAAE